MSRKQKKNLTRIIISAVLYIAARLTEKYSVVSTVLYVASYAIVGYDILRKAIKGVINHQVFDENFLMATASLGSIYLGELSEAVMVMLLYQIGEFFQSYAVGKSRENIVKLMDIRPDYANIEKDGELIRVDPQEVEIGTIITVMPSEKIPIDGIVVDGEALLNTSALTGESLPVEVRVNSEVVSGCIDMNAVLKIKTTQLFAQSTASRILELVENASSNKSKSEDFISKFAKVYTPFVCGCALVLATLVPLAVRLVTGSVVWSEWVYRALTFLVISCPCAFVISIPLTFFAAIGGASRKGILIKGSNYLETLSKIRTIAFDKTGTITRGVFEVVAVHGEIEEDKIIELAALAESYSSHPIAKCLIRKYGKPLDTTRVDNVQEISGNGIIADIDGKRLAIGNDKLMHSQGVQHKECHLTGTIVHVALEGKYLGHIVISDILKPNAKSSLAALKDLGIRRLIMLTGDKKKVAEQMTEGLGIDEINTDLLPQDKYDYMERYLKTQPENEKTAYVGDGLNDAPVLAIADLGIAMGEMGSAAAIEAADVVLMDDDLMKLPRAVEVGRKCMRIVYENIWFVAIVKVVCMILGAFGIASMWLAIFADVGVMVLAVINAIRCLK